MMRRTWIDKGDTVALTWQCALAGVSRSAVYARQKPKLIALDDEELKRHPFYASRNMEVYLGRFGHCVNRKRAQRLMRTLGLAGMAPGPNTSRAHPQHKVYPYLAARRGRRQSQPSLEHRHHLHSPGTRLCLLGGGHRLVLPASAQLVHQ